MNSPENYLQSKPYHSEIGSYVLQKAWEKGAEVKINLTFPVFRCGTNVCMKVSVVHWNDVR